MAKIKIDFDAKKIERQLKNNIEKVIQEEQKKIDIQKNIEGVGKMIILNEVEEETLDIIICNLKNNSNSISLEYHIFPNYIYEQLKDILYKLKMSGYIASSDCWLNGFSVTLTPMGLSYFEKKRMRKELFEELPSNAKELLNKLLEAELSNKSLDVLLNDELKKDKTNRIIRGVIRTLKYNGLLTVHWASNQVCYVELTNAGRTYFEREKRYMEQIKQEINEKGQENKEELSEILEEVKDYIDNMKETKTVSKNTELFKRIGKHFTKHQWFYSQVIGLLGQAILLGMENQV